MMLSTLIFILKSTCCRDGGAETQKHNKEAINGFKNPPYLTFLIMASAFARLKFRAETQRRQA